MYYYRQNKLDSVVTLLQRSLYAEQMVCSMTSQLFHIPTTKNLKGLQETHENLYESSYHRVTALGSANRLVNGESHSTIKKTLVECIKNAQKADQKVRKGLNTMKENAPNSETEGFLQVVLLWENQKGDTLRQAREELQAMTAWDSNSNME